MSEDAAQHSWEKQICLVGDDVIKNSELKKACQTFKLDVVMSETGKEHLDSMAQGIKTIFVVNDFEGFVFETLAHDQRVLGVPAVVSYAEKSLPLRYRRYPIHNVMLENKIFCFSGFRMKEEIRSMNTLVHYMGGETRKDMTTKVNYLIAAVPFGEKYQFAANLGIPVISKEWLYELWSLRHNQDVSLDDHTKQYRYKTFAGRKLVFWGFSEETRCIKEKEALAHGGAIETLGSPSCTHIVIDSTANTDELASVDTGNNVYLVKDDWFTVSMVMNACADESLYLVWKNNGRASSHPRSLRLTPSGYSSQRRKRPLPKDTTPGSFSATEDTPDHPSFNNLSSLFDNSPSRISRDYSPFSCASSSSPRHYTPSRGLLAPIRESARSSFRKPSPSLENLSIKMETMTRRQQVVHELLKTECNYVDILNLLVNDFMKNAEMLVTMPGDKKWQTKSMEFLDREEKKREIGPTEIKIIFGNLPPILAVHVKLKNQLFQLLDRWNETNSIGKVFIDHAKELLRVYPPFVNFFEDTKNMIQHCEAEYPEFQMFLKQCKEHPKSARQPLTELIIRPVQRLPSIHLLLNDILKHTEKSNPDYAALEEALKHLKEVLNHINEDKRKTERQVAMFDVANDVEGCPPTLISSHRKFTTRANVVLIRGDLAGKSRGSLLALFLFSDVLEVCKIRTKTGTIRSRGPGPSTALLSGSNNKPYKHVELLRLLHIRRIIDIRETESCTNAFGILVCTHEDLRERMIIMALIGEDIPPKTKKDFLHKLAMHVIYASSRTDLDNLLIEEEPERLNVNTQDVVAKAWSSALKVCTKIGRNLTMRRITPKRTLTRAMSAFITPVSTDRKDESPIPSPLDCGSPKIQLQQLTPLLGKKVKPFSRGQTMDHS